MTIAVSSDPLGSVAPVEPFVQDSDFTLYTGEALEVLQSMPSESVHCVVTSPPYFGLRDYGTATWEGGNDPDCPHGPSDEEVIRATMGKSTLGSARHSQQEDAERSRRTPRSVCPLCGARRIDSQVGMEASPEEFVDRLVTIFREVRRVLRKDGTVWLNIGDSYAGSGKGGNPEGSPWAGFHGNKEREASAMPYSGRRDEAGKTIGARPPLVPQGCKPKDLIGIPWMLAFALRADGWYLRSEVIWSKPNAMPESITDRPTKSHEQVFLLSKSPIYYYDQDAIREPFSTTTSPGTRVNETQHYGADNGGNTGLTGQLATVKARLREQNRPQTETLDGSTGEAPRGPDGRRQTTIRASAESQTHENHANRLGSERWPSEGKNRRSVWEIVTSAYKEAHFAVFPQKLVEPCVLASTSEKGCCATCGAPWVREVVRGQSEHHCRPGCGCRDDRQEQDWSDGWRGYGGTFLPTALVTGEWKPSCGHQTAPVPCVVLDPFMGSGTTALVARRLGRRSVGIELNPKYAEIAATRLSQLSLFAV